MYTHQISDKEWLYARLLSVTVHTYDTMRYSWELQNLLSLSDATLAPNIPANAPCSILSCYKTNGDEV